MKAAILVALILLGCSTQISQEEASLAAQDFVKEHVKFFTKNGTDSLDITTYEFSAEKITKAGKEYEVMLNVTATLGNETKERALLAKIDRKSGLVTEFNGQQIK